MNETEAQAELAEVAVALDAMRGRLARLRDDLDADDEWPLEMDDGGVEPTMAFRLFANVSTLLEDHIDPGIGLARLTAELTAEAVHRDWEADRNRTLTAQLYLALSKMAEGARTAAEVAEIAQRRMLDGDADDIDVKTIRRTAIVLTEQANYLAPSASGPSASEEGKSEDSGETKP